MILIRVDLPAPLSPTRATTSPWSMARSMSWSTRALPKDLAMPSRRSSSIAGPGPATASVSLANLRVGQRLHQLDVVLGDEGSAGIHVEAGEAEAGRQIELDDRDVALDEGLLVDDDTDIAVLDALADRRRQVEAGAAHLAGRLAGGLHEGRQAGGERAVIGDRRLDVGVAAEGGDV